MAKDHIKPEHYKGKKFSPWEVIEEYFRDKWHVGTAFKYMSRMGKKIYPDCTAKESELHDIRKAIQELQRHEELLQAEIQDEKGKDFLTRDTVKSQGFYLKPGSYRYYIDKTGKVSPVYPYGVWF